MVNQHSKKPEQPPVQVKQRIIGAIVLVSLGVIFIPMLLNSERSLDDGMPVFGSNIPDKPHYITDKEQIAPVAGSNAMIIKSQPDFDARVIDEHTPKTKKKVVASFAKIDSKNKETTSKKKTVSNTQTKKTAKAWAIQVGSFTERKNAFSLRNKLRSKKFTAFVESVETKKGQVFRVRVGPEIKRAEAEKIQKKLLAELKIKGLVIAHP